MPEPLRIALLTHSVLPRGGVVHTLELAGALARRGHAVTVVAPAEPGQSMFREPAGVALRLLPTGVVRGTLVEQVRQRIDALTRGLPGVLAEGNFDLLHGHDSLGGNALASLQDDGHPLPPWLRTIHHLDHFDDPQLDAWQARAWQRAGAIGCVSDTWVQHLKQVHGRDAQRLHNGVDLDRFRPEGPPEDADALAALGVRHGFVCLSVGGVEHRKNSPRLLAAFAHLRRTDPAWREAQLIVCGGASLLDHSSAQRAWNETLAALGWTEGPDQPVWRTGPLPDALLPPLMRHARVLAMPSLMEGFGLVALEALACGTPALVSRRAPFTEHLSDEPHVGWCDPEDIASIAAGLQATALLPRPTATPPVCQAHGWAASAAHHEDWYRRHLVKPTPQRPQRPQHRPAPAPALIA